MSARKTSTRKKSAPKGRGRRAPRIQGVAAGAAVRVRMYNVGFGDAFLVQFPASDRPRNVLIDCGVHPSGPGPRPIRSVVSQIIADVTQDGTPRLDLVVCTHRHADHVSGFVDPAWKNVEVGEVWMPWTEDRDDPEARRIREAQSKIATRLSASPGISKTVRALADNALRNAKAMATLHDGFRGAPRRRFLPQKDSVFTPDSSLLPGVNVHVLGPSRDPDEIRDMDPPEGETYLRLGALRDRLSTSNEPESPFRSRWTMSPRDFRARTGVVLKPKELRQVETSGSEDALAIAVQLEKAVNGTSLMLMFQLGEAHLLFPGDAQWGTWSRALANPAWRELLHRTTFLKVGHHGSHNATPREFVKDVLQDGLLAMVSTRANTNHWDIPRTPLMTAIRGLPAQLARSDRKAPGESTRFTRVNNQTVDVLVSI